MILFSFSERGHSEHGILYRCYRFYPNPLANELVKFQYTLLLCGIRRTFQKVEAPPKLPITPTIFRAIRTVLDLTLSFDVTFWAEANLLVQSKEKFDDRLHLRRNDFSLFTCGAVMNVCWNKTIQFRQRKLLIPLPRVNSSHLCPLAALLYVFHLTKNADPFGPAFTYSEEFTLLLLTYNKFQSK